MHFFTISENPVSSRIHRQLLRAMKLTIFLLIAGYLHVSAAAFGQTVSISGKDMPLEKVFTIIKKQTGYVFFYDYSIFQNAKNVTLDLKDADIEEVMKACLRDQGLEFSITNKTISVVRREEKSIRKEGPGPEKTVKAQGAVYNESGQPLSGANITIKETGRGTITNAKGEFQLFDVPVNGTLVVSYTGYAAQKLKIKDGSSIQVYLSIAKNELDKVVVQAYGTTTQRLATGNIATVTAEQIERHPVMNVLQALQGQVPGVVVQQTSGYASAPFKVEIRGRNSINPNLPSDPLYIIDGVPLTILNLAGSASGNYVNGSTGFIQNGFTGPANGQSPFFSINPSDIESLTVLKDADATAIYGSRGANGVIIITTKKGKPGKTRFDLNLYSGSSIVTGRYDLLNLPQYLQVRREAFKNDGIIPDAGNAYDLLIWDTTKATDWQKKILGGIGKTIDAQASLSGGDKLTTFRISGDYHRETSILNYSGADQRASVQFNLSRKSVDQRLNISFTNIYSFSQSNLITLSPTLLLSPDAPGNIFDQQGHLNYSGWKPISDAFPFANILQPYTAKTDFLNSQLSLQYQLLKGLNISSNFGYSINHVSQIQIFPIASEDPSTSPTGNSSFGNNNGTRLIVEPQLEYKGSIGVGRLTVMVGGSAQSISQDANSIEGYGYINDALLGSVSNAPLKNADNSNGQYKYAAIFSRINYNWEDRYILNLSARRDGSSRFGSGNKFGNFGAFGAAWIFTEEGWFKNHISFLSFGKLRASYGITGSDQIGDYQYLTQWSASGISPYQQNVPSYVPLHLANDNLHWEENRKLEMALNLGFFKDRINVEGSFYRNRCNNQLIAFPLPSITGFGNVTANSPANVQNKGWEVTFRAKIIDKKDIFLNMTLNGGRNYNKLLGYPNLLKSPYFGRYIIGEPLNLQTVIHYTGIDPQTGQYTFQDRNKDGIINPVYPSQGGDFYYREVNVLLDGSMGLDFRYKGLSINALFTFRHQPFVQSSIYNGVPGQIGNQSLKILNRWQKPGDMAKFASYTTQYRNSDGLFNQYSDAIYSDGSYIRFRNLAISYELLENWVRKAGMHGCKIFLRGENLFVVTKYIGLDPDTPGLGALPPSKVFTGGIQFNF